MKLIDRKDIEDWARRIDSKAYLPLLVSRLVHSSTPKDTFSEFPDATSTFVGGWDGKVESHQNTSYVPLGISLWEFGTEKGNNRKAEEDYQKRKAYPLGHNPKDCTFIFATPSFWRDKDKWRAEKIEEGFWRDIKVYDSRNLEDWIDKSPAVSRWFSTIIRKYPTDGIQTIEDFWKEWSYGPRGKLPPSCVTSGRERESKLLQEFLESDAGIKAVKGSSKDEAIAFIIATAHQFAKQRQDAFFSKTLIIDTANNFRSISTNQNSLNLISRIEEHKILYRGVSDGHHVLVVLGGDDSFNSQDIINLPIIDRDGQIQSMVEMGLTQAEASRLSRESGRNISILKRLLDFPDNKIKWTNPDAAKEIIPALLIGRWDEAKKGDKEILEQLSGITYDSLRQKLILWTDVDVPPLMLIGTKWRLTSPLDAWINLSRFIIVENLDQLKSCFIKVLSEQDNTIDLDPSDRLYATLHVAPSVFSDWAREGLTQSMILVGLYGEGLKIPGGSYDQLWVDMVIRRLLSGIEGKAWASLNPELPLIAEASPEAFLDAVNDSISIESRPIMEMFVEENSLIDSTSRHTGLLWALEGLAWMPQYFTGATTTLAKLAELDPGGKLLNRPINSLTEIFKPWYYQTLTPLDERISTLKQLVKQATATGWKLLIRMLPSPHSVAHPTHKMRWRMFNENSILRITYGEIWDTYNSVIEILLAKPNLNESEIAQIVEKSAELQSNARERILNFIESNAHNIKQVEFSIWHQIRKILSHHRSFPTADWALPESELTKYENLFNILKPSDTIEKNIWMFDEHWPGLVEGIERRELSIDEQEQIINDRRSEGLKEIYQTFGIEKIMDLAGQIKEPWIFGSTFGQIVDDENDVFHLLKLLNHDDSRLIFIQSFIFRTSLTKGLAWVSKVFHKLSANGYSDDALGKLFVPIEPSRGLWDLLEQANSKVQQKYWQSIYPRFWRLPSEDKILGISNLIKYARFISAIEVCYHSINEIPTEMVLEVLERAVTEKSNEERKLQSHEVEAILSSLDGKEDVDTKRLFKIEWYYLPILSRYGTSRSPRLLHEKLSTNPNFFIEVLKLIYKPDVNTNMTVEDDQSTDEQRQQRAMHAYDLLHSWKRIPGMDETGKINREALLKWLQSVRVLAKEVGRLEVADMHVGQVLAQYREDVDIWPPEEISSIIDSINTDSLKSNFSAATSNKRGSSTRGPFDGGDIERRHAEFFKRMAEKNRIKFPITSTLLINLSKRYQYDARMMDQRAEIDKLDS